MSEKRTCEGCGKDYWWPAARWQHDNCGSRVVVTRLMSMGPKRRAKDKPKFDRVAYQRIYMRKWRAAKKKGLGLK